jgi:hypothetical protein
VNRFVAILIFALIGQACTMGPVPVFPGSVPNFRRAPRRPPTFLTVYVRGGEEGDLILVDQAVLTLKELQDGDDRIICKNPAGNIQATLNLMPTVYSGGKGPRQVLVAANYTLQIYVGKKNMNKFLQTLEVDRVGFTFLKENPPEWTEMETTLLGVPYYIETSFKPESAWVMPALTDMTCNTEHRTGTSK